MIDLPPCIKQGPYFHMHNSCTGFFSPYFIYLFILMTVQCTLLTFKFFLVALYPPPAYAPAVQTIPVDNDINNTTVSPTL